MTISIVAVAALALLLWCVMWIAGFLGSSLPKRDWKRLPLTALLLGASFGIIIGQFAVLTATNSDRFARNSSLYVLGMDCPIGIVLLFYAAIREERKRKSRS